MYLPRYRYQKKTRVHDLSKYVLEQLQCPVCMQYMLPHITLCDNGHNIYSSCKQKIQKCPTCREPILDTQNKAFEKLAIQVDCLCPNELYGLIFTFPIALIREREDVSQFGPFDCPLNQASATYGTRAKRGTWNDFQWYAE